MKGTTDETRSINSYGFTNGITQPKRDFINQKLQKQITRYRRTS
jgi:hypothetical protein